MKEINFEVYTRLESDGVQSGRKITKCSVNEGLSIISGTTSVVVVVVVHEAG
jgi:hypothetical protein